MNTSIYTSDIKIPISTISVIVKPILLVIILLYAIMSYYNSWMLPLVFVIAGFFIWLQFFCGKAMYRYTLTQEGFSIERISRRKKSKNECIFSRDKMLMLAPSRSDELNAYIKKGKKIFMKDYTSGLYTTKEYVLVCEKNGEKRMILLELCDEMLHGFTELFPTITKLNSASNKDMS